MSAGPSADPSSHLGPLIPRAIRESPLLIRIPAGSHLSSSLGAPDPSGAQVFCSLVLLPFRP